MTSWKWLVACGLFALSAAAPAAEVNRPWHIYNRLRLEYDDNVYLSENDTQDSINVIEQMEFHVNLSLEQTSFGFRYRPSYVYWFDREPDDTDFNHEVDLVLNHDFTERLSLSLIDTFRASQLPELIDRGTRVRDNDDYVYNSLSGTLSYLLQPATRLDASARDIMLRYDEQDIADREDYDLYVGGLTVRHQFIPETAVSGDLRYETIAYEGGMVPFDLDGDGLIEAGEEIPNNRDSDTLSLGGGIEQTFSPNFLGNLRAGWQQKSFDSDQDDENSPYGDASLTFLPSPKTRITTGVGYSLFEADVFPFNNQERTTVSASIAHDLTARVSWSLSTSYTRGDYSTDNLPEEVDPDTVTDGTEDIIQLSTRVSYKINRSNWLEAGWQYTDLDTDLRESYERNRLDVGWRVEL